jgi:hypothetical protein
MVGRGPLISVKISTENKSMFTKEKKKKKKGHPSINSIFGCSL